MATTIWYDSDEVGCYHPAVEGALNRALVSTGYDSIAEVEHHPVIPNSSIVPDFALRLKSTNRFVFVIEVKRTQRDVESQRYQNQSRSYVTDFGSNWEPSYHKYFCVTNIERLITFAERPGLPITGCLLKKNPFQHRLFDTTTHDATNSISDLQSTFESLLPNIFNRVAPQWDDNWQLIIDNFHSNYVSIKGQLGHQDSTNREITLFELFRLLAYAYLKDYYTQTNSNNASHFRTYPLSTATLDQFKTTLSNNYNRIIQLDFKQVFSNHPDQNKRIFPENFNATHLGYFKDVIQCINLYNRAAVADNSSPSYVFNLLTSKIYDRIEMHSRGKVMSDSELLNLIATICIDSHDETIFDPGCGDGALLDAAYDRLSYHAIMANIDMAHNDTLSQLYGYEIDPFLSQLASFRLISKNLTRVDTQTSANIEIGDVFINPMPNRFDVVLMNSPFLRNDNPNAPITASDKLKMTSAITQQNLTSYVSRARQPNLYHYFTNYAWHYLNANGKYGIIIMAKFLNNLDGKYLKEYILDKVEYVISYPRKYFSDFAVTTLILVLKKGNNSAQVSFLRISDESMLADPDRVKATLNGRSSSLTAEYNLKKIPRSSLLATDNWEQYLYDPKLEELVNNTLLVKIDQHLGTIKRGGSDNIGASTVIYPERDINNNEYFGYGKKLSTRHGNSGQPRTKIVLPQGVINHLGAGIQNNRLRRAYILNANDLSKESAIHFQNISISMQGVVTPAVFQSNQDTINFYNSCASEYGLSTWRKVVGAATRSTIVPKILIPRADRIKHAVYYSPNNTPITISTNFFYCRGLRNPNTAISTEDHYKFITAFLLSCFGQLQFECFAGKQEGLRKLEKFQLLKIKVPNLMLLTPAEASLVIYELNNLSQISAEFSGDEGINTPRRDLDLAIGKLLYDRNSFGFYSESEFVDYYELLLADMVENRRL